MSSLTPRATCKGPGDSRKRAASDLFDAETAPSSKRRLGAKQNHTEQARAFDIKVAVAGGSAFKRRMDLLRTHCSPAGGNVSGLSISKASKPTSSAGGTPARLFASANVNSYQDDMVEDPAAPAFGVKPVATSPTCVDSKQPLVVVARSQASALDSAVPLSSATADKRVSEGVWKPTGTHAAAAPGAQGAVAKEPAAQAAKDTGLNLGSESTVGVDVSEHSPAGVLEAAAGGKFSQPANRSEATAAMSSRVTVDSRNPVEAAGTPAASAAAAGAPSSAAPCFGMPGSSTTASTPLFNHGTSSPATGISGETAASHQGATASFAAPGPATTASTLAPAASSVANASTTAMPGFTTSFSAGISSLPASTYSGPHKTASGNGTPAPASDDLASDSAPGGGNAAANIVGLTASSAAGDGNTTAVPTFNVCDSSQTGGCSKAGPMFGYGIGGSTAPLSFKSSASSAAGGSSTAAPSAGHDTSSAVSGSSTAAPTFSLNASSAAGGSSAAPSSFAFNANSAAGGGSITSFFGLEGHSAIGSSSTEASARTESISGLEGAATRGSSAATPVINFGFGAMSPAAGAAAPSFGARSSAPGGESTTASWVSFAAGPTTCGGSAAASATIFGADVSGSGLASSGAASFGPSSSAAATRGFHTGANQHSMGASTAAAGSFGAGAFTPPATGASQGAAPPHSNPFGGFAGVALQPTAAVGFHGVGAPAFGAGSNQATASAAGAAPGFNLGDAAGNNTAGGRRKIALRRRNKH